LSKFGAKSFLVYWGPVILWLGIIFLESVSVYASSDQTGQLLIPILHWLFPGLDSAQLTEFHHLIRKTGHLTGYGLLSYFLFRAWRGTHWILRGTEDVIRRAHFWRPSWALLALLGTAMVASLDEMHQMTLPNRTGSWWDVLLDTFGGLVFQIAILLFIGMRTRSTRSIPERVEA